MRSGALRGIGLVVIVFVVAILLMPSATRAPLAVVATTQTTVASPPTTATSVPSTSHSSRPSTTPASSGPATSSIQVLVANATNVNGVAGAITRFLGGKGYSTLTAVNALTTLGSSQIYFTSAGSSADAAEVASALGLTSAAIQPASSNPPVSSTAGAAVVVVAGQDLATRFAQPTTTTTGS